MTTASEAFPIDAKLTGSHGNYSVQIQKLTTAGCLVQTDKPLGVGHHFTINFVLPGYNAEISSVCVVVKTYTGQGMIPGNKLGSIDEIHFKTMESRHKTMIDNFVRLVGSTGKRRAQ